jgi:mono/diheme cytochrome c family protein
MGGVGGSGVGGMGGVGGPTDVLPETEGYFFFLDNCEACHGLTGGGEAKDQGGPNVAHPDRELARWVIRNGRVRPDYVQNMRVHLPAELPDPVLEEILDYLESVPKPATPQGLFLDYCANCHGEDAKGGLSKKDLTLADEAKIIASARLGRNPTLVSERERYMPLFTPEKLSDQELGAIAAYIVGL